MSKRIVTRRAGTARAAYPAIVEAAAFDSITVTAASPTGRWTFFNGGGFLACYTPTAAIIKLRGQQVPQRCRSPQKAMEAVRRLVAQLLPATLHDESESL